jgi:hypothetical protein
VDEQQHDSGLDRCNDRVTKLEKRMSQIDVDVAVVKRDVQSSIQMHADCSNLVQKRLDEQRVCLQQTREEVGTSTSEIRATVKTAMWFVGIGMGLMSLLFAGIALLLK